MKIPGIIPAAILIAAVAAVAYYFPGQPWTYGAILAAVAVLKLIDVQLPDEIQKWITATVETAKRQQPTTPTTPGAMPAAGAAPAPLPLGTLAAMPKPKSAARRFLLG